MLVADRDGDTDRESQLRAGVEHANEVFAKHPIAWGLAIESVEAWTLGVPDKIAEELGVAVGAVRELYPPGVSIEALSEKSGKEDHRPKRLLEQLANLKYRSDSTMFRQAIAERTDPAALEKVCPQGFGAFAARLRSLFAR